MARPNLFAVVRRPDLFAVVRRVVPPHGIKVGCKTEYVAAGLLHSEADKLADLLQIRNPGEEYAVVEMVFHRWTHAKKNSQAKNLTGSA